MSQSLIFVISIWPLWPAVYILYIASSPLAPLCICVGADLRLGVMASASKNSPLSTRVCLESR